MVNIDITDFRCCLCPNSNTPRKTICPSGGPAHKPETPCRFVVTFLNNSNQIVYVAHGIDKNKKKWLSLIQYRKRISIFNAKKLPPRNCYDEAQHDLNAYAINEGWSVYKLYNQFINVDAKDNK